MNLKEYFSPLIKWWWMILAAALIAAVASFVITLGQPPIYESRTTLIIGQSLTNPNPNTTQFFLEQQLAAIYADMANREPVRRGVMEELGLAWLPQYNSRALPETQLIEIVVTDSDPVRAQAVAASIANQLVIRAPTTEQSGDQDRMAFVEGQLSTMERDIEINEQEIENLKLELGNLNSASQINQANQEIASQEAKLRSLRENYSRLLATTQQGAVNTLAVIEPAEIPIRPIGPNRTFSILIASLIGLGLAGASAYVIEWLDQTIHSADEAGRILHVPALGEIPKMPKDSDPLSFVNDEPFSPITDSFRSLRTNLEFLGLGHKVKTILIASPGDSEGKTTIAVNLAIALAKAKKRVILIDADFYKSELDKKFGLEGKKGLGDLILDGKIGKDCLIPLFKNQVYLVPSGTTPPNPSEQLGSVEMVRALEMFKEVTDVIIVDGPPFIISDALVLSARVDGVLIVVSLGKSRRDVLIRIKKQMVLAKANILGYIVNGITPNSAYYYGNYYHTETKSVPIKNEQGNGKLVEESKGPQFGKEKPVDEASVTRTFV